MNEICNLQMQMSWQPSLLNKKRKDINSPPIGLKNLGNSCYLNSVLQCLTYTPPLANLCLRLQHSKLCANGKLNRKCPFCILERRIVRSLTLNKQLDAPARMQRRLRIFAEHFCCGRQEDAHEFLRSVIDACHNTCLRLMRGKEDSNTTTSVVKEIFGGALQSQVKCLSCNYESNKVDEIMDISVDVSPGTNSVSEALQRFFQAEILNGDNSYRCGNCNKLVSARKQMSILEAPNILVIQLKRFGGVYGDKIDKKIAFEQVLHLSRFMCEESQDQPGPDYGLFGTIVHLGTSPQRGHYYAYIKDTIGRWYRCNDSVVTPASLHDVLSENVYILFFARTEERPAKNCNFNGCEASINQPKKKVPKRLRIDPALSPSVKFDFCTVDDGETIRAATENGLKDSNNCKNWRKFSKENSGMLSAEDAVSSQS